jgi:hypothetical protein
MVAEAAGKLLFAQAKIKHSAPTETTIRIRTQVIRLLSAFNQR